MTATQPIFVPKRPARCAGNQGEGFGSGGFLLKGAANFLITQSYSANHRYKDACATICKAAANFGGIIGGILGVIDLIK
jgi:hypothetical protein